MSKTVKDGEFYVRNRKKQETNLKKDLDGIEGFDVISRLTQKKTHQISTFHKVLTLDKW